MRHWLAPVLVLLLAPSGRADRIERFEVHFELLPGDVLAVEETIRFGRGGPETFERTIPLGAWRGRWPLRQRVEGLEVTDGAGRAVEAAVFRSPGERVLVRVAEPSGTLRIAYRIRGALSAGEGEYAMRLGRLPVPEATLAGPEGASIEVDPTGPVYRFEGGPGATGAWIGEVWRQLGFPLGLGLALLLLAPLAARLGPAVTIPAVRLSHLLLLAVAGALLWPMAVYHALASSVAASALFHGGLFVALQYLLLDQDRAVREARRDAWAAEFALPFVLLGLAPLGAVEPGFLVLPLVPIPLLVVWSRPRVAAWFGASAGRIAERVAAEGETDLEALAAAVGLPPARLARILAGRPALPVALDPRAGRVYSAEAAALRPGLALCAGCGAASLRDEPDPSVCLECRREYAAVRRLRPKPPAPAVVEAAARLADRLGRIVLVWTAPAALVSIAGAIEVAVLVAALGSGAGAALLAVAGRLRAGRSRWLLGPLLVLPAFRSRRVRLHFGRLDPAALGREVVSRGELGLPELARLLGTDESDAAEVACWLAGDDRLDAVYDRVRGRLRTRARHREVADPKSCPGCGGLLGIASGRVVCHHCGRSPASAVVERAP